MPPLPPNLPPLLHAFSLHAHRSFHLHPLCATLPMLAVASAAIGASRSIRLQPDDSIPPILWTALLTPPNPSLSQLFQLILSPLISDQAFHAAAANTALINFRDELEAWNKIPRDRRCPRPRPSHPSCPMTIISSPNPRFISRSLHANPRGLLLFLENLYPILPSLHPNYFTADPLFQESPQSYPPVRYFPSPTLPITGLFPPSTAPLLDCSTVLSFLLFQPPLPKKINPSPTIPAPLRLDWSETISRLLSIHYRSTDPRSPDSHLTFTPGAHKIFIRAHTRLHRSASRSSHPTLRTHLQNLIPCIPRLA